MYVIECGGGVDKKHEDMELRRLSHDELTRYENGRRLGSPEVHADADQLITPGEAERGLWGRLVMQDYPRSQHLQRRPPFTDYVTGVGVDDPIVNGLWDGYNNLGRDGRYLNEQEKNGIGADRLALRRIVDRFLGRAEVNEKNKAYWLASGIGTDPVGVAASPRSNNMYTRFPGTRLALLAGFAVMQYPSETPPLALPVPPRIGLEPVIFAPGSDEMALFPAHMRVHNALYNASMMTWVEQQRAEESARAEAAR